MKSLNEMSETQLQRLKVRHQFKALKLEQSIAKRQQELEQKAMRTALLNAAYAALDQLMNSAQAIFEALQVAAAAPTLVAEQQLLVANYQRQRAQLPSYSDRVPSSVDLILLQTSIQDLEFNLTHTLEKVAEIKMLLEMD